VNNYSIANTELCLITEQADAKVYKLKWI